MRKEDKKSYKVKMVRDQRSTEIVGTIDELIEYFSYTLECGKVYEWERGNHKINREPKTIASLVKNVNWAMDNSAGNGYSGRYLEVGGYTDES